MIEHIFIFGLLLKLPYNVENLNGYNLYSNNFMLLKWFLLN